MPKKSLSIQLSLQLILVLLLFTPITAPYSHPKLIKVYVKQLEGLKKNLSKSEAKRIKRIIRLLKYDLRISPPLQAESPAGQSEQYLIGQYHGEDQSVIFIIQSKNCKDFQPKWENDPENSQYTLRRHSGIGQNEVQWQVAAKLIGTKILGHPVQIVTVKKTVNAKETSNKEQFINQLAEALVRPVTLIKQFQEKIKEAMQEYNNLHALFANTSGIIQAKDHFSSLENIEITIDGKIKELKLWTFLLEQALDRRKEEKIQNEKDAEAVFFLKNTRERAEKDYIPLYNSIQAENKRYKDKIISRELKLQEELKRKLPEVESLLNNPEEYINLKCEIMENPVTASDKQIYDQDELKRLIKDNLRGKAGIVPKKGVMKSDKKLKDSITQYRKITITKSLELASEFMEGKKYEIVRQLLARASELNREKDKKIQNQIETLTPDEFKWINQDGVEFHFYDQPANSNNNNNNNANNNNDQRIIKADLFRKGKTIEQGLLLAERYDAERVGSAPVRRQMGQQCLKIFFTHLVSHGHWFEVNENGEVCIRRGKF